MRKKIQLLFTLLIVLCLVTSCMPAGPDMLADIQQDEQNAVDAVTEEPAQTAPKVEATPTPPPASEAKEAPEVNAEQGPLVLPRNENTEEYPQQGEEITKLQLFVDASFPMMGFVDIPERSRAKSQMKTILDCVRVSAKNCFPSITETVYRATGEGSLEGALLPQEKISEDILERSFYLSRDLVYLPKKVYDANGSDSHSGERMNETIEAYPGSANAGNNGRSTPVKWGMDNLSTSGDTVSVIISDLSEIQSTYSELQTSVQNLFANDKTVGVLAVRIPYSGLLPCDDGWAQWVQWGSLPTGSLWKMLNYGAYSVGISIDPDTREVKRRPLYLLCIGPSDAVSKLINTVHNELNARVTIDDSAADICLRAFDTDLSTHGINVGDTVKKAYNTDDGLMFPNSEDELELKLQRVRNTGKDRYIIYEVVYPAKITDPRYQAGADGYQCSDFAVSSELLCIQKNGDDVQSDKRVQCTVESVDSEAGSPSQIHVRVKISFPYKFLERGDYKLRIDLTLNPPALSNEVGWVEKYNLSSNAAADFDGSKTRGLTGFFSIISGAQKDKIASQGTDIGGFTVVLNVSD